LRLREETSAHATREHVGRLVAPFASSCRSSLQVEQMHGRVRRSDSSLAPYRPASTVSVAGSALGVPLDGLVETRLVGSLQALLYLFQLQPASARITRRVRSSHCSSRGCATEPPSQRAIPDDTLRTLP